MKMKNIWNCFDEIASAPTTSVKKHFREENTKNQQIEEELKTYLGMSLIERQKIGVSSTF